MNYPRIIAHRCGGALAPENSLSGLGIAARLGCRGVEFDVMLSRDGVPFLMHDEMLERTTDGSGRVADLSIADIQRFDAGGKFHKAFGVANGVSPAPTLKDAMAQVARLNLWANIEIKPSSGHELETGVVVGQWLAKHWNGNGVISSFAHDALQAAMRETQTQRPEFRYAALFEKLPENWSSILAHTGASAVHMAARHLTAAKADTLNALGVPWACYTVNSISEAARLFALGCAAIFTDRPDLWAEHEM
jgi:glycerophosphoryl diester phosphodiesterase